VGATLWLLRTFPVTLGLTTVIVIIGILTGTVYRADHRSILDSVGFDLEALKSGRLWTMPAATLIQAQPGIKWHLALFVLVLGPLEYLAGSLRTLVTFFLTDWVSAPLTTLTLWALTVMGSGTAERLAHTPDMGSSAAASGTAGALAMMLPGPMMAVALGGLFLVLGAAFTFEGLGVATAHLIATGIGVVLGFQWRRRRVRFPGFGASRRAHFLLQLRSYK
jgi:hypothetical protein